ncbi:MAG: hypothetical protein ACYTEQ_22935 [Planctomycetota bacterium]|jgi:hypothetical protein
MEDLELRLRTIPLAKPPRDMKKRIFGTEPSGPRIFAIFRRRIPLGWAAALALFAGLTGTYVSPWLRPAPPPAKAVIVQIIKAPSERNPFDFTEAATEFMQGELDVTVKPPEEI